MTGLLGIPGDWRHHARCTDHDPELWFPDATAYEQIDQAKAICQPCPVRINCLNWALETGQGAGIWGGKDERELRLLRRRGIRHGTGYAYNDQGCRCQPCCDAHAQRLRAYRRDKKQRSA